MKVLLKIAVRQRGSSLIEAVIAMGVLAVAIPLVFGAIAESGRSNISSEAETRSTWIVPTCLEEIQASRDGMSKYFIATKTGETFPATGDVWALVFSPEGKVVGKIDKSTYDKGAREMGGKAISYIASLSATKPTTTTTSPVILNVLVRLEYPAGAPATKRQKIDFYTHIP